MSDNISAEQLRLLIERIERLEEEKKGISARHHDLTGHATWCDVNMSVRYGTHTPDNRQIDVEDAIGASAAPEGQHP